MTVVLMVSKSDPTSLSKDLQVVAEYTGTLREKCSIIDPVIRVQLDEKRTNIPICNYLQIPEFGRYYFIQGIEVVRNNLWEISCHVDVMYTYAEYIKQLPGLVTRSATDFPLVPDNKVTLKAAPLVVTKNFPLSMGQKNYLVTLIGADNPLEPTI